MYNDLVNKSYFFLIQKKRPFFTQYSPKRLSYFSLRFRSIFHIDRSILLLLYVKWDQKDEMEIKMIDLNRGENDVENKTGILYNDTVDQWRDVAQLGSAFVLGTKCHGFKSCHPYLLLLLWAVTGDFLRSTHIGHII